MSAAEAQPDPLPEDEEEAVNAVIEEFGGDARKAIAALLHDLDALAADARSLISHGYVRGIDIVEWRRKRH